MRKNSTEGIVVKVTENVIVLLCNDGTFQNVAKPSNEAPPLIGERYTHIEKKISWLKYSSIAAVFMLAFITYMLLPFGQADSSYVVAIDINPSIELVVNDEMKVIETSANNHDGETLLASVGMEGQQLADAIQNIITYSEDAGYFLEEKFLTTSVIPVLEQKSNLIEEIEQIITSSNKKPDLEVVVQRSSKADYDEAKKSNLSVNHYAVIKELEKEGTVKTVDEVKGKTLAELRKMQKSENIPSESHPGQPNNNSNRPESVGSPHEDKEKGTPPPHAKQEEREKGTPPDHSQGQQNKQQKDENQKNTQNERTPQNQGQGNDRGSQSSQGNQSKNNGNQPGSHPNKGESKQRELPKVNENNRGIGGQTP